MTQRPIPEPIRRQVERTLIGIALIGLISMVQPLTHSLFRVGFWLLLAGGLGYVATTFWPPEGVTVGGAVRTLAGVIGVLLAVIGVSALLVPWLL